MDKKFETEQENFWAGTFGNEYLSRNDNRYIIASNTALFSKIIEKTNAVKSIIEFGANIGLNLEAIRCLLPNCDLQAVEINKNAADILKSKNFEVYNDSILDFKPNSKYDLVLIKGVLIHINPEYLQKAYQLLYETSKRYILIAEYYNPVPVEINYRGHEGKLFKRDFAGELLDNYPSLSLVDYGFVYHRDNNFPCDDVNWFLLEKAITPPLIH